MRFEPSHQPSRAVPNRQEPSQGGRGMRVEGLRPGRSRNGKSPQNDTARQSRNQNPKLPQKNPKLTKEGKIIGAKS